MIPLSGLALKSDALAALREGGKMWGIQPIHLLVVAIVALILFGPKKLPELGRWIAKAVREVRGGMREMKDGFHDELAEDEQATAEPAPVTAAVATVDPQSRFCTLCGALNQRTNRFCHQCGKALSEEE
jgi:sec-independent protein translocase protein TatA